MIRQPRPQGICCLFARDYTLQNGAKTRLISQQGKGILHGWPEAETVHGDVALRRNRRAYSNPDRKRHSLF